MVLSSSSVAVSVIQEGEKTRLYQVATVMGSLFLQVGVGQQPKGKNIGVHAINRVL